MLVDRYEWIEPVEREDEQLDHVLIRERFRLTSYFRRAVANSSEAADLFQTLWMRVAASLTNRQILDPEAYIWRSAANLVRDRSKMAARRSASRHDPLEDHHLAGPSLESQLEARDMLRLVEAAMLELRPRTREVFMAVRVDGMTYAEVRAQTGYSSKIIEKEMARALAHLNRATGRD